MAKHERQAYERLGARVLTLPDVIAQSVGSPLSVLIAAVGVFAIGAIVSRYASSELSDLTKSTA